MAYGSLLTDTVQSSTTGTPPQFNDGSGTQIGTLCRAWVNFNGVTTATVRASFNVSSVTRNGTGDYTVNFTNAMPDANFSTVASLSASYGAYYGGGPNINTGTTSATEFAPTTTTTRMFVYYMTGGNLDSKYVNVAVFR